MAKWKMVAGPRPAPAAKAKMTADLRAEGADGLDKESAKIFDRTMSHGPGYFNPEVRLGAAHHKQNIPVVMADMVKAGVKVPDRPHCDACGSGSFKFWPERPAPNHRCSGCGKEW